MPEEGADVAAVDPNDVRLMLERDVMRRLTRELGDLSPTFRDYQEVRREWFWGSELLSEAQHARVHHLAAVARARLGVARPVEIFQKAGGGHHLNAVTHRSSDGPMLVQLQGDLLERLDDDAVLAILGHEMGHHLAHGPCSMSGIDPFFLYWRLARGRRAGYREIAAAYCRAAELTADRIGLLASRSLGGVVRMANALDRQGSDDEEPAESIQRSREYAEALGRKRDRALGDSHPEGAARIFAIWLFSESDVYRRLTGLGTGSRPIAEIDWTLAGLVGPSASAEDMGLPPEGDPCLLDRAREQVASAHHYARAILARARAGVSRGTNSPDAALDELTELDRDPLEEKFAELERQMDEKATDDLERQFVELERREKESLP